jgi:hypothetical protein
MADIPRYQESGIFTQPTPRLDLANLKQQEASSTSMASALDRVSEFAFKKAAIQATREGEQWAYNNPITPAQIEAANRGALDIATTVPAPGTVFADAVRKTQAGQLRSDLELAARSAVANVARQVEAGEVKNLKELNDIFYGIQEGYGKILGKIDPEQANALRASIATISNPTFIAAAKKIGEISIRERKETTNAATVASDSVIRSHIVGQTDPVALNNLINNERKTILDSAAQTMDPAFVAGKIKELDTIQQNAYIDVLSKHFRSNDFAIEINGYSTNAKLDAILSGKVGKYKNIWATLSSDIRDKVADQFMKVISKEEDLKQIDIRNNEKQNKVVAFQARDEFYKSNDRSVVAQDALIKILIDTDTLTTAEQKAIRSGEETKSSPTFLFNLNTRVNQGKLSESEVNGYLAAGKINYAEAHSLQKDIQNQSQEMGAAKLLISTALKIPTEGFFNASEYKEQMNKQSAMVNTLVSRQDIAKKAGKLFDPVFEARKLIGETVAVISEDARRKAEEELKQAYKDANIKQPKLGTYTTKEALEIVKPTIKKRDLERILDAEAELRKLR